MAIVDGRLWIMATYSLLFSSLLGFAAEQPVEKPSAAEPASAKQRLITTLIRRLGSPDQAARDRAAKELGVLLWAQESETETIDEKRIELCIRQLGDMNFKIRERAAQELIAAGLPALEFLRHALSDPDIEITREAGRCIPLIERQGRINDLILQLKDSAPKVRAKAADDLREMGPIGNLAIPALVEAMQDENENVRLRAVVAIRDEKVLVPTSVGILLRMLNDEKEPEINRFCAMECLERMDAAKSERLALCFKLIKLKQTESRFLGVYGLRPFGKEDPRVLPALLNALDDSEVLVVAHAVIGLELIGRDPARCIPPIVTVLKRTHIKKYEMYRGGMIRCLKSFGPEGRSAVSYLVEVASDAKDMDRSSAFEALGGIGQGAVDAIPALEKMAMSKDFVTSRLARRTLEVITRSQPKE